VVGIDEAQFFTGELVPVIRELLQNKKRVIVAGLDLDFRGEPFGIMPTLLALADEVTKLHAICSVCGNIATKTQRLIMVDQLDMMTPPSWLVDWRRMKQDVTCTMKFPVKRLRFSRSDSFGPR